MYAVGLTGNIGAGKTTALQYFKELGAMVISADDIAKKLTQPNTTPFNAIIDYFGKKILTKHGEIDRKALRNRIFNEKKDRVWLENLLHPLIRQSIESHLKKHHEPYAVIEIPLLTDKDHYPYLDHILTIETSTEQTMDRIILRDNTSKKDIKKILQAQPSNTKRRTLTNDLLLNNNSMDDFFENIKKLHLKYLHSASNKRL